MEFFPSNSSSNTVAERQKARAALAEKRSERSVPKLTDWDFGIPPLQTTFLVKTALRTLMEPLR
jgi:hypothetical protein